MTLSIPALPGARHRAPEGATFSLVELDAFDKRRADTLCGYCAKPVGLRSPIVVTAAGSWAHVPCHEELAPVVAERTR